MERKSAQGNRPRDGNGLGPKGVCLCAKCGHRAPHTPGVPCMDERCPACGGAMVREGSDHHQKIEASRASKNA
jgi:predicted amidophosphoribosyltransferase